MPLKRPSGADSVPSVGEGLGFFSLFVWGVFCLLFFLHYICANGDSPIGGPISTSTGESSLCDRLVPSRVVTAGSSAQNSLDGVQPPRCAVCVYVCFVCAGHFFFVYFFIFLFFCLVKKRWENICAWG